MTTTLLTNPLPFTTLDTWRGIKRSFYRFGDVVLFIDELSDQKVLIAERPSIDGPEIVEYVIGMEQRQFSCQHLRARATYWTLTDIPLNPIQLLQPNRVEWPDKWRITDAMSLGMIVTEGQSLHDTGDAPEHGALPAFANDAAVSVAQGRVIRHLPTCFRDMNTLKPLTVPNFYMGPNKWGIKQVDVKNLGVKCDNAHVPALWKPALEAVRGTVLERFFYDSAKLTAVFHVNSDWPTEIWRKPEVRMQRALRNVAQFLIEAQRYGDNDMSVTYCRAAANLAFDKFEGSLGLFSIKGGVRTKNNNLYVALWEYAHLAYALHLCEIALDRKSTYLANLLKWTASLGEMLPTELQVGDTLGGFYDMARVRQIESDAIALAAMKKPPVQRVRYHELCLFDWLRVQHGMAPVKSLSTYTMLDTTNWAGFRLPFAA